MTSPSSSTSTNTGSMIVGMGTGSGKESRLLACDVNALFGQKQMGMPEKKISNQASFALIILLRVPPNFARPHIPRDIVQVVRLLIRRFLTHLTRFCFKTHVLILLTSLSSQLLGILALFTKETRWVRGHEGQGLGAERDAMEKQSMRIE
ncbi:hypothetical protein NL676_032999 [Syzygium grande]|nr:hypothetical protein NL676_032999 [Syzygium grande]